MNKALTMLVAVGIGAGVMYLLDPQVGRRRRAIARDKAISAFKKSGGAVETASTDIGNRAKGLFSEAKSRVSREEVSDQVLAERVRSQMGRYCSHPSALEVSVSGKRAVLRGPVLEDEVDDILRAAARVRGVTDVVNQMNVHKEAGDVPALQGAGKRPGFAQGFMRYNWSPTYRLLATGMGSGLALYGFARAYNPFALSAALAGLAFAVRGATNTELQRVVGLGAGRQAVTVQKTVNFEAPVEKVFEAWDKYENFPKFMTNVEEVRDLGNGRSHWVVKGPAGTRVEWDAEVTKRIPNEVIAWKSSPGSLVQHSGIVKFKSRPGGGSTADVRLSYNPIAGKIGHAVASLFSSDPKTELDQDLQRMKQLVEGELATA
jgi:uncharacterized membrane protein